MLSCIIALLFISPIEILNCMIDGATDGFELCFDLLIIYAIWLGLLQIAEDSGLNNKLAKAVYPFTKKLFKGINEETNKLISMNIATNMLGMGGVSTPMGIEAMKNMQDGSQKATPNMKLLMVIACTSLQILPTTVIGLRTSYGSANAADIFLPTLIATIITTIFGITVSLLLNRGKKK
jgi:spore maturation protein A